MTQTPCHIDVIPNFVFRSCAAAFYILISINMKTVRWTRVPNSDFVIKTHILLCESGRSSKDQQLRLFATNFEQLYMTSLSSEQAVHENKNAHKVNALNLGLIEASVLVP